MNNQPPLTTSIRVAMLAICALLMFVQSAAPSRAQTSAAPPAPKPADEAMVLSPFEVTAATDTGYIATNTLAGSRLSSSLLTTPAVISVFTKDLLADLSATAGRTGSASAWCT